MTATIKCTKCQKDYEQRQIFYIINEITKEKEAVCVFCKQKI